MASVVSYAHFGSLTKLFKAVFQELEVPDDRIVQPTPPSKLTMEIGVKHSPEWMCTPFKMCVGSIVEV